MLRTTLIAAISAIATIGLMGAAVADGAKGPSLMTDEAMDTIVAGETLLQSWSVDKCNFNCKIFGIPLPVDDLTSNIADEGSSTVAHGPDGFIPIIKSSGSVNIGGSAVTFDDR